jgi:hypothetical protein
MNFHKIYCVNFGVVCIIMPLAINELQKYQLIKNIRDNRNKLITDFF